MRGIDEEVFVYLYVCACIFVRAVQAVALSQNFAPAASKNATKEYLRQGCDTVILQHACVRHLAVVTKTK